MTTFYTAKNWAKGTLSASISATATSATLNTGNGASFPSSGTYPAVVYPADGSPEDGEIIEVTARSTDVLTLGTRGFESTTGKAHSAGELVVMHVTAGYQTQMATAVTALEGTMSAIVSDIAVGPANLCGGYGSSGVTIGTTGDISTNGDLLVDGSAQIVGLLRPWTAWVPARQFASASGSPTLATLSASPKHDAWALDASAVEELACFVALPPAYTGQTIKVEVFWTATSAGSGDVRWIFRGNSHADGDTLAAAFNADVDDTFQGASKVHIVSYSATESTGRLLAIGIGRRADNAADTLAQDALFLGAMVSIL